MEKIINPNLYNNLEVGLLTGAKKANFFLITTEFH